nr:putative inactive disease susceptibility protein LOV1 [Coffea arabica]
MAVLLKNADMHLGYLKSLLLLKLPRRLEFVEFLESIKLKLFLLLRVLRFDGFDLRESKFVGEVGKLTSLRYLSFRDCRLNNLPLSLGELLYLQTLDLRIKGCMSILPHIICYSLTRIVLSRSTLVNGPMATLGRFPNLWDLVLEDRAFLGKRLTFASGGFGQLRHLTLSNLPKLEFLIEEEDQCPIFVPCRSKDVTTLKSFQSDFRNCRVRFFATINVETSSS